jgi:multidrug efflux pump subunit AcrA (membrane-fusion protein)
MRRVITLVVILAVDVGQEVKKGQLIAKIDPTDSVMTLN